MASYYYYEQTTTQAAAAAGAPQHGKPSDAEEALAQPVAASRETTG
jgi:hypothetical protein